MRNAIMQKTYVLNDPMVIFFVLLPYYYLRCEKVASYEKFSRNLTLDVQIVSMLLMEVLKCWKIVEFLTISIKIKNFKTFYEV